MDRAVPADEDGPRMFYSHTDVANSRYPNCYVVAVASLQKAVHQYNAVINILRHGGLYRAGVLFARGLQALCAHPYLPGTLGREVRAETNRWTVMWSCPW